MSHFVLVDCNNFYASCERLFQPSIEKRAVVVLSNNDGCVIARSQEAKQLGIQMGTPYFQIKKLCKERGIFVCSSNYQLYGDLSRRVMNILSEMAPEIQIYSIDEAFLRYPKEMTSEQVFEKCIEIRNLIKQWVGIPTSVGIAPTKTLAKAANALAKKDRLIGVFNLSSLEMQEKELKKFPIGDVWGIGSGLKAKLQAIGIHTAWEFQKADPLLIRKQLGVVGERMLWELRGISCLELEEVETKKSITCSRSFGKAVTRLSDLSEAIATFTTTASFKLRQQQCYAKTLGVYVETYLDLSSKMRGYESMVISLPQPTNETPQMISAAKCCIAKLFRQGQRYKKCGVILLDLILEANIPLDLFSEHVNPRRKLLAQAVDALNARFGKNAVFYGAMGTDPQWKMRSEYRSKHYTTDWQSLAIAKA